MIVRDQWPEVPSR